jgi:thymidylate synthase
MMNIQKMLMLLSFKRKEKSKFVLILCDVSRTNMMQTNSVKICQIPNYKVWKDQTVDNITNHAKIGNFKRQHDQNTRGEQLRNYNKIDIVQTILLTEYGRNTSTGHTTSEVIVIAGGMTSILSNILNSK